MSIDYKNQYDKIYNYCYLHVHNRETAEDLTQETFLKFLEHKDYQNKDKDLQYLYTIAKNLCIDEYRKKTTEKLNDDINDNMNNKDVLIEHIVLKNAVDSLSDDDRQIILLRYVNELPVSVISKLFNMSRFALYRRIKKILAVLRNEFEKEASD